MSDIVNLPKLYTVDDVASYLDVSVDTVRREVKRGKLGYTRIGGRMRFTEDQITGYVGNQRSDPCESESKDGHKLVGAGSPNAETAVFGAEHGLTPKQDRHVVHRSAQQIFSKPNSSS